MLIIFNCAYAFWTNAAIAETSLGFPSISKLVAVRLLCGLLNAPLMLMTSNLLMMPISVGSFPFYVFFFAAGCAVKTNGWLE